MASGSASSPSVQSSLAGANRKSKDIGWDFAVCPDPTNTDKVKCTLCGKNMSGGGGYKNETTYCTNNRTSNVMSKGYQR